MLARTMRARDLVFVVAVVAVVTFALAGPVSGAAADPLGSWSSPNSSALSGTATGISCPSASGQYTCVATATMTTTGSETAAEYSLLLNQVWEYPADVFTQPDSSFEGSPSCAGPTFCMAAGEEKDDSIDAWATFNGSGWTTLPGAGDYSSSGDGPGTGFWTCASAGYCAALNEVTYPPGTGPGYPVLESETYNGTSWSGYTADSSAFDGLILQHLSCVPDTTFCLAVGHTQGQQTNSGVPFDVQPAAATVDGSTVTPVSDISSAPSDFNDALVGVSCTSMTFCMVTDELGYYRIYDPQAGTWSTAELIAPDGDGSGDALDNGPDGVSCGSSDLCIAIDSNLDTAFAYVKGTWGPQDTLAGDAAGGVSCPNVNICYAEVTGSDGYISSQTYTPVGALKPPQPDKRPDLTGKNYVGALVSATHGTWVGSAPFTYSYTWLRCTDSTCTDIAGATGSTYRLTFADVGDRVRALVIAANGAGSAYSGSNYVTNIQLVSVTVVKGALGSLLAKEHVTTTAGLLEAGGTKLVFTAPSSGQITVDWYAPSTSKGPLATAARPAKKAHTLLVARVSKRFSKAGKATLKLRLTAAGRRLLRHSKKVGLTSKATFTPTGGTAVTVTRHFTVKKKKS